MPAFIFQFARPRHPLLRLLLAAAGLALLAMFSVVALAIGAVVLLALAVRRLFLPQRAPTRQQAASAAGDVIEGEFSVVRKPDGMLSTQR